MAVHAINGIGSAVQNLFQNDNSNRLVAKPGPAPSRVPEKK